MDRFDWVKPAGDPIRRKSVLTRQAVGSMEMTVGAYDGVVAYGLVHLCRAIAELVEGVEHGLKPSA